MFSSRASLFIAISVGLLAGVGYPFVDRMLACREAASEACVWGKAYFPLTLGLSLVLIGGSTAGVIYGALSFWRKRKERPE